VDKAGRATEPSLMVAPSGGDADPDEGAKEAAVDDEVMSSSRDAADTGDEADRDTAGAARDQRSVPFPADEIGKPKSPSPDPADDDAESDSAVSSLNGKLDSGRQAVRQAMTATSNWFSARTAKDDPPAAEEAGRPARTSAASTAPSFTPASQTPATAPASQPPTASSAQASRATAETPAVSASTGRSLWRDAYASSQSAKQADTSSDTPTQPSPSGSSGSSGSSWSAGFASSYSGPSYAPPSAVPGSSDGASAATSPGPGGRSSAAATAVPAVGGAAARLASYADSVTADWKKRNSGSAKRNRETAVRRSARRQAQLTLARVEPWSVMKFSFVVSVVAFIILFVAIAVLYMVLSGLGVFNSLQHTVSTVTSSQGSSGTNISTWFSASRILGYTGMLGALNIVLITAMSTIGSVIYNLIARTIGGIEVTLRETE
jgi:hypothetical protein